MRTSCWRIANAIGALLLLASCGWHLQGSRQLPTAFSQTQIETDDRYTAFYRELRRSLLASGAQVAEGPQHARAVVRVRHDATGQRVAAVSARNTPEEYQVFYAVDYSVMVDGVEVAPSQHVELTANYSYNTTTVLAKQREQTTIQQALARELASLVLRRLSTVSVQASRVGGGASGGK